MNPPLTHKAFIQATIVVTVFIGIHYLFAWTAPTGVAPANNVLPPINEGTGIQVKNGGLGVTNFVANSIVVGSTTNANAITSPKFCIGTSCITSWPTGSSSSTGGGWVNVDVNENVSQFDDKCIYRMQSNAGGGPTYRYSVATSPSSLYFAHNIITSWWGGAIYNTNKALFNTQGSGNYTVTKIEMNCGGGGSVSSTGVVTGWPDVIKCARPGGPANDEYPYYLSYHDESDRVQYTALYSPSNMWIMFTASNGAFYNDGGYADATCSGKSIQQIKDSGRARYF